MARTPPGRPASDPTGEPGVGLFFAKASDGAALARRRIVWPAVKGRGRRRVSRLGVRPDRPGMPRWPAPVLALLAVLAALAAGMVDIALNVPGIALLTSILLGLCWGRALRASDGRGLG